MESLSVHTVLGLIGLVILTGLAGELLFRKTGVPSVLFLLGLGVLIGPVFGLVNAKTVTFLAPYFGTIALLIILFDGGLNLHITKVLKEAPLALLFALSIFVCTAVAMAAFYVYALKGAWLHGLLLGSILSGTTPVIVMPIVQHLKTVRDPIKVLLSLESAFGDVFIVVSALTLMGVLAGPTDSGNVLSEIFHAFLDSLVLASVAGILWARLLAWMKGQALSYMLTLAAIFLLYDVAELLGGNGVMTILTFGLILGNMQNLVGVVAKPIRQFIGFQLNEAEFALDTFLKRLNEELSFLVRTFFFVLLGLIFEMSAMNWHIAISGIGLFCVALAVRGLITLTFGYQTGTWTAGERAVIVAMLPRGVAVAVMSFLPTSTGIPDTELFPVYAMIVIAAAALYMTFGLAFEHRREDKPIAQVAVS